MANRDNEKNSIIKKIIVSILIIIFIFSVVYIIIYFYNNNKALKEKNLLENIVIDENNIIDESTSDNPEENAVVKTENMLKLEELQKENSDIVAYIEIDGTNISYPVLQTTDNDYYVTHNYKKEYSKLGAIFLDKDSDLNKPTTNFLIYGHRAENGTMFEDLDNYQDESYYKEHPIIKFITPTEESEYEIIAVFLSRVYYKSETNVFRYYYFINAENEEEYNEYVTNSKKASLYDTGKTAEYGDQLLTLSTCEYSQEDGRLAVVAKKIK